MCDSTSPIDTFMQVNTAIHNLHSVGKGLCLGELAICPHDSNDDDYEHLDRDRDRDDDDEVKPDGETKDMLQEIESSWTSLALGSAWATSKSFRSSHSGDIKTIVEYNGEPLPEKKLALLALCKPSPYGDLKTGETKVDKSVRHAYEIRSDDPKLTIGEPGLEFLNAQKKGISDTLYNGREIDIVLNKVNVYPKGGMFKEHQDTPKPGVIGTLVIQLPYNFHGGKFSLRASNSDSFHTDTDEDGYGTHRSHRDASVYTCSFASSEYKTKNSTSVEMTACSSGSTYNMVAFYCESPHKIDTVTDGVRVTISFYIVDAATRTSSLTSSRTSSGASSRTRSAKKEKVVKGENKKVVKGEKVSKLIKLDKAEFESKKIREDLTTWIPHVSSGALSLVPASMADEMAVERKNKLDNLARSIREFDSKCGPIGIFLRHKYSNRDIQDRRFRGIDQSLYQLLASRDSGTPHPTDHATAGADGSDDHYVAVEPIIVTYNKKCYRHVGETVTRATKVYRLRTEDIKVLCASRSSSPDAKSDAKPDASMDLKWLNEESVRFVGHGFWDCLQSKHQDGVEHTGNEASPTLVDNIYSTIALIFGGLRPPCPPPSIR